MGSRGGQAWQPPAPKKSAEPMPSTPDLQGGRGSAGGPSSAGPGHPVPGGQSPGWCRPGPVGQRPRPPPHRMGRECSAYPPEEQNCPPWACQLLVTCDLQPLAQNHPQGGPGWPPPPGLWGEDAGWAGGPRGEAWVQAQPIVGFKPPPGRGRAPGPHKESLNGRFGSHGVKYLNGAPSLETTMKASRASPHQTQEDTGRSTCTQGPRPGSLHRRPNAGRRARLWRRCTAEPSDTGCLGQARPVAFGLSPHPSWLDPNPADTCPVFQNGRKTVSEQLRQSSRPPHGHSAPGRPASRQRLCPRRAPLHGVK